MTLSLVAMSHSPLLGRIEVEDEVRREVEGAFSAVRDFVRDVDPELVITVGPAHYNGFFYDTMPPFCLGLGAYGLGDYDTSVGDLDVPTDLAEDLGLRRPEPRPAGAAVGHHRMYLINGCGHWLQIEHADEFTDQVLHFLAS